MVLMPNHNEEKIIRNYLDVDEVETINNALEFYAVCKIGSIDKGKVNRLLKMYPRNIQFFPDTPNEPTFRHLTKDLRDTLMKALGEYCGCEEAPDLENAYWLLHELKRIE
jgi:hypothetical protein